MLKPFSEAISTRILRDANGTSRGVGFARWKLLHITHDLAAYSDESVDKLY